MRVGDAGEFDGLVLVGDQQVGGGEEFGWEALCGGRGEDRADAVPVGRLGTGDDGGEGEFELEEQ
ncbi:hypothetical protein GCM10023237_51070 [Streptomyces coeruleoprunus]